MPKGGNSRNFSGCWLLLATGEAGREEFEDSELEALRELGLELRLKLWRKLLDRDRTKSPKSNMIELPVDISQTLHYYIFQATSHSEA